MRLGQLARKLSVKPGEIIRFLENGGFPVEGGSNARLDDDLVRRIIEAIAPDQADLMSNATEEEEPTASVEEVQIDGPVSVEPAIEGVEIQPGEEQQLEISQIEVIRAPKIELPGLRVVGKIDLPEPKKKEETPAPETMEDQPREQSRPGRNDRRDRNSNRGKHQHKNPVVLQREREERQARKQKQLEAEKEKQRRTENYLKKFKTAETKASKKKVKKPVEPLQVQRKKAEDTPRSVVGKFRKWLFRE